MDVAKSMSSGVTVSYSDGRDAVSTKLTLRGQVNGERKFDCSVAAMDRVEQMYYLVWASLHYSGKEPNDFESFLDLVDDVAVNETTKPANADPTQLAQLPD